MSLSRRIGTISAVDEARVMVRVRLPECDNLKSNWLAVLQRNSQDNKDYWLPDMGEQVEVLLDDNGEDGVVLGADTTVVLDGAILGKPENREQALAMLGDLSKREHQVLTAVALTDGQRSVSRCVSTTVAFRTIHFEEALRYWDSGEPADKAGGYAIQGLGAVFVSHIQGSYSAVVGLPLSETAELLEQFAIPCWQPQEDLR